MNFTCRTPSRAQLLRASRGSQHQGSRIARFSQSGMAVRAVLACSVGSPVLACWDAMQRSANREILPLFSRVP